MNDAITWIAQYRLPMKQCQYWYCYQDCHHSESRQSTTVMFYYTIV